MRGLVERLEQALGELEQTDEAACEKFAAVIAKWLKERGDGLASDEFHEDLLDFSVIDFEIWDFPDNYKEVKKNVNAKRAAKLLEIARYYGEEKQVCKLMEELGEAVSARAEC